ncbi:MAG: hypothetical protein WCK89_15335 [bacterium]
MKSFKTTTDREMAVRVGERIRQVRAIKHITQVKLATDVGMRVGPLGWIVCRFCF